MFRELEKVARSAALQAGSLIREYIGRLSVSQVHLKAASDYVTEVDLKCESIIISHIRKHYPDHHIMSEETANDGLREGWTWVIDPLDGTANFIHGFPFVAVSIAACRDGMPVMGVVFDPVREEMFSAQQGCGAFLNEHPIRMRVLDSLEDTFVATGFPHRTKQWIDPYLATFREIFLHTSGIRRAGAAALDLAYLASGRVDGFWEAGLKAWDVAAGSLLVSEVGGVVTDYWGRKDYLLNGHIVAGGPLMHEFLLEAVSKHMAPALENEAKP